ncbi:hypothetical protein MJO52_07125 [Microbulbifer variabilis]|uniref:Uncharacterized protein n=1 Tax=Microbulbifer variabilis TaxID=266805 RepID=A0ABY4VJA3_9GAMM|nr:hypothetical protein [Microbulbifer variabilis]USD22905.1 hypothetical protein MJO52_07125 [Microbulbifer variabilis]
MITLNRLCSITIAAVLTMASTISYADDSIGTHGMALFSVNGQLIASHMPLHGKRHGHQLILALESENKEEVMNLAQNTPLISLKPEVFSLNQLRNGKLGLFSGEVFNGHFERKGKILLSSIEFTVTDKLLDLPLSRKKNGHYRLVHLGDTSLLIHEIASPPSFDQIVEVTAKATLSKSIDTGSKLPISEKNWPEALKEAGIAFRRQVYLETRDFQ